MPIQAPQWTEFLSCPVCCNEFDAEARGPVSLACGHSICRACLASLHRKQCPFDQSHIRVDVLKVPANSALLRLVGAAPSDVEVDTILLPAYHVPQYRRAIRCVEDLAMYLRPISSGTVSMLSRPMQRKLVTLANCQLLEAEGRSRALRAARSLGERTVTELLLQHQNPQQLSANLWAAVRARGCQFLGPAMQEEVLKLVLLALEDGSALSRKVLVMFVVQRLEPHYSQASKTSIGHVVQLLYRASCFKVSKREGDSSLMQLKEEFRSYEALRREHDAQIVQIATEAGLRIAPDQWSSLLYGDTAHKSHMQSIMDKLQTPQSFAQSVQELVMALQRTGDPGGLLPLRPQLELLASIDSSPEAASPTWDQTAQALEAARSAVGALAEFASAHGGRRQETHPAPKYKVSMCRDLTLRGSCPRGQNCTFAHSETELERFRSRMRKSETPIRNAAYDPIPATYCSAVYSPASVSYPANGGYMWWLEKDRMLPRNANALLLAASNGEHIEHADISCGDPYLGKMGSLMPEMQNMMNENVVSYEHLPNLNLANPWFRQASITSSETDPHFYVQPSPVPEPQKMKHRINRLEKRLMDLKFAEDEQVRPRKLNDLSLEEALREEELYEAGIAEDMKVLEEQWESELAEQERRWSESDPRPHN